jgi:hypothetical protein
MKGSFEVGNQVLISSHRKLLSSKAMVVNVRKSRNEISAGITEKASANARCRSVESGLDDVKTRE